MRYLIAILVMMTVLLASLSCRQAGEGKIPGNGDLEPITQAQPASTEPETAHPPEPGSRCPPSRKQMSTGAEKQHVHRAGNSTHRSRNQHPRPEGRKRRPTEGYRRTSGPPILARVILPGEVGGKTGAETKGSRGDPGTTLEDSSAAPGAAPGTDLVAASGRSPRSPDWHRERIQMQLKAGEVDDNQRWQEYLDFALEYRGPPVHATNLSNRQIVTVLDRQGNPVPNAQVNISRRSDGTGATLTKRTYADGRTMFFPLQGLDPGMAMRNDKQTAGELSITVRRNGFTKTIRIVPETAMEHEIALEGTMTYGLDFPLDVVFLIDSTGSMADEIHRIKTNLESIARQVSNLPANPDLRFGMVSYRDRGDEYVTRLYPFDGNVQRFSEAIQNLEASGGGDYPESLNEALHEAVNNMGWRENAIRLIFLIADAPPHLDYPQDKDYATEMMRAQEKGIKVFSVASSGLDQQGEYILRQIAQQTMGKFLFILYPTGPRGGLETPHDVEQYSIDRLDSLIVKLIGEELAKLRTGVEQSGMMMK